MQTVIIVSVIVGIIIIGSSIWAINKGYSRQHRDQIDELHSDTDDRNGTTSEESGE